MTVPEPLEEHHGAPLTKNPQHGQDAEQTQKGEGEPAIRAEYKASQIPSCPPRLTELPRPQLIETKVLFQELGRVLC